MPEKYYPLLPFCSSMFKNRMPSRPCFSTLNIDRRDASPTEEEEPSSMICYPDRTCSTPDCGQGPKDKPATFANVIKGRRPGVCDFQYPANQRYLLFAKSRTEQDVFWLAVFLEEHTALHYNIQAIATSGQFSWTNSRFWNGSCSPILSRLSARQSKVPDTWHNQWMIHG